MSRPSFPALAAELVDEVKRGSVDVAYVAMVLGSLHDRGLIDAAVVVSEHRDAKCWCRCCADAGREILRLAGPQGRKAATALDRLRATLARISP